MIAYFLGVNEHSVALESEFQNRLPNKAGDISAGALWSQVVKEYMLQFAYPRAVIQPQAPGVVANVIYNGENPLNSAGYPVCMVQVRKLSLCPCTELPIFIGQEAASALGPFSAPSSSNNHGLWC